MIKVNPNKNTKIKFKINVTGTSSTVEARLILMQGSGFWGCEAELENSTILAVIPGGIFHHGQKVESKVEVIVGKEIFVPWKGTIYFEEERKIEVVPVIEDVVEETKIEVEEYNEPMIVEEVKEEIESPEKIMKFQQIMKMFAGRNERIKPDLKNISKAQIAEKLLNAKH